MARAISYQTPIQDAGLGLPTKHGREQNDT